MRKIKLLFYPLSFLTLLLTTGILLAQPKIEFENPTHDFGKIQEEGGSVTNEFFFKNVGDKPLVVSGVKASCGCTTPSWTKEAVQPGEKGSVTAEFNPYNRPGDFSKSLTITSNAQPGVKRIFIKGHVEPRLRSPEERYKKALGGLLVQSNYLNMGDMVETKESVKKEFDVYNATDAPITFQEFRAVPDFMNVEVVPESIPPKEIAKIVVDYNPKKRDDLGLINDMITLTTDEEGQDNSVKNFNIMGRIVQFFPEMTDEEKAKAPKIFMNPAQYDFGNLTEGDVVSQDFTLTNTGKQDLIIRKFKSTCGCTASSNEKDKLKPGQSTVVKVSFDSKNRKGKQYKYITMFSNDPERPELRIAIQANVRPKAGEEN